MQKNAASRKLLAEFKALLFTYCPQKCEWKLKQQATAITRLAVGCNCATVGQTSERSDRRLDDPMTRHIIEIRDQSKTATVALECRVIETL